MSQDHQHCLARIRAHYPQFSTTEKKIADFILKRPEETIHSSINGLSDRLGVADSTVFRFCKRVGFKGFQAMKIALASEIMKDSSHDRLDEGDTPTSIASKVFRSNCKTIEDTLVILDEEDLMKAVQAMETARSIEFFGSGGSGIVALDGYHKFIRTGLKVHATLDSHIQLMAASQMTDEDCAIFVSHSGSTKDILHILDIVKSTGATTIGITNFAKSPLSQQVDIPLFTVSEETDYRNEALSSRIAQLTLIDTLYANLLQIRETRGQESIRKMQEAIKSKRG
ncbi:MurR/RpiR family transcriptional regulator [Rossellomorea marisflavi]|uniref:MurR/RpiR family transcriptional regulator n=1 Tax=Rossellomorea marisflavi TaxID=189381 RepID=UPI001EE2B342|nr:MurR/RpiR family transcriptional regulator [Rossellomorea marisflavi]UKS65828.1 MurR/RpiR family transcriptional regulator [Rossellomorea marisflavi]